MPIRRPKTLKARNNPRNLFIQFTIAIVCPAGRHPIMNLTNRDQFAVFLRCESLALLPIKDAKSTL